MDSIREAGITTVHEPQDGDAVVDIVIVHGLQGHPYKTWACTQASKDDGTTSPNSKLQGGTDNGANKRSLRRLINPLTRRASGKSSRTSVTEQSTASSIHGDVFWPRNLLPEDFPQARIMVYGYDTKVTKYMSAATNQNGVYHHSKDLLHALAREREQEQELHRPLIFIAHSLGGIIVKEMLARSSVSNDNGGEVVKSTHAVAFLGTPHRGSPDLAALGEWARSLISAFRMETNSTILDALGLRTTDLERAQDSFSYLWQKHDFRVKTFQEGLGLTGINLGVLGNKVVPDYSSLIGDARERAETIQANHMEMCRFIGHEDTGYLKVSGEIRLTYNSLTQLDTKQTQDPEPTKRTLAFRTATFSEDIQTSSLTKEELLCLEALRFPTMNRRYYDIEAPAKGTCKWIFDDERYHSWLNNRSRSRHHGLLWLKGNPGVGKSTIVKEIYSKIKLEKEPEGYSTAAFFFNAKGEGLEHSTLGLFRSLLYQLLPQCPECLGSLSKLSTSGQNFSSKSENPFPWGESQLKSLFERLLTATPPNGVFLFIDALDECDAESVRSQVLFWGLVTSVAYEGGLDIHVCLSSRKDRSIHLNDCFEIDVADHNSNDIAAYVNWRLALGFSGSDHARDLITDRVLHKSSGIFLWVVLVVNGLLQDHDEGRSLQFILGKLAKIPKELEDLCTGLLQSVKEKHLTLRLFQWAILSTSTLRLHEWHHILGFIQEKPPPSLRSWRNSDAYTENDEQLVKRLRILSKGLLEVKSTPSVSQEDGSEMSVCAGAGSMDLEHGDTRTIHVIHESIRDFFLHRGGFFILDPNNDNRAKTTAAVVSAGHLAIMHTCLDYIEMHELDEYINARIRAGKRSMGQPQVGSTHPVQELLSSPSHGHPPPYQPPISMTSGRLVKRSPSAASIRSVASFSSASSHATRPRRNSSAYSYEEPEPDQQTRSSDDEPEIHSPYKPPSYHDLPYGLISPLPRPSEADRFKDLLMDLNEPCRPFGIDIAAWRENGQIAASSRPSSTGKESRSYFSGFSNILEAFPALLSYATTQMFIHARLAEEGGADPRGIIRRLVRGQKWARLMALTEGIAPDTGLLPYAVSEGLISWIKILADPGSLWLLTRMGQF